jgi:hypothetical protein
MTIHPTHHCFDDALDFLALRVISNPSLAQDPSFVLVHGIRLAPDDVTLFAHAWVEHGSQVWDAGLLDGRRVAFTADRAEYYRHGRVQCTTRYTCRQAFEENRASGHYGPWLPAYLALCSTSRRVWGEA